MWRSQVTLFTEQLPHASRLAWRFAFGGLLLLGGVACGVAQTNQMRGGSALPASPVVRIQQLYGRAMDPRSVLTEARARSAQQAATQGTATTDMLDEPLSELRVTNEPSASIEIFDVGVQADFFPDTVIRSEDSDECVARLNSYTADTPAGSQWVASVFHHDHVRRNGTLRSPGRAVLFIAGDHHCRERKDTAT